MPPFVWCDPVHPGPRLLVNWPPPPHSLPIPPHSKFPSPQGIPNLVMRPAKTTSRSQLYIVRNKSDLWEEIRRRPLPSNMSNYCMHTWWHSTRTTFWLSLHKFLMFWSYSTVDRNVETMDLERNVELFSSRQFLKKNFTTYCSNQTIYQQQLFYFTGEVQRCWQVSIRKQYNLNRSVAQNSIINSIIQWTGALY